MRHQPNNWLYRSGLDPLSATNLCYKNYELNQKLEFCNSQIEYYSELNEEFHKNLYASQTGSYSQGTHSLSISDIYYQKYFNSNDKEK